ncbi:MAG: winged helix-turn-helix transcriptional regulator [Parcubacteria group bacterium]|nr:winged helix-turn-helix transcriptional regulator [Parcubacteria group bacterium]
MMQAALRKHRRDRNKTDATIARVQEVARFFGVLSDPTRLKIFLLLCRKKQYCVGDVAETIGVSISNASHQLHNLELTGLLVPHRTGRTICYRATRTPAARMLYESARELLRG